MAKRALVIGLGRSGRAAATLLHAQGFEVVGIDSRGSLQAPETLASHHLGDPVPSAAYAGVDLMVLSPGVPPEPHRAALAAESPDAEIAGELGYALLAARRRWPAAPAVLITGTNGKSTVTALLGHLLSECGRAPFVGGNLGTPLSEVLVGSVPHVDALVLECSSYQLETLPPVATEVAMVLNISPDHMDRYDDLDHYAATKGRIFGGVTDSGLALTYARDARTSALVPHDLPSRHLQIEAPDGPRILEHGDLRVDETLTISRTDLPLAGRHNAVNALFALTAARHLGLDASACAAALRTFPGLPHRMQRVAERDGVVFYDDSKATNVASVLASLDGFERPVVLIAGGRPKGDDLGPLISLLAARGRGLVALGEAREELVQRAQGRVPVRPVDDMNEAVEAARTLARDGDAVVLSPACASWDMYESFAHRGRAFCAAVLATDEKQ